MAQKALRSNKRKFDDTPLEREPEPDPEPPVQRTSARLRQNANALASSTSNVSAKRPRLDTPPPDAQADEQTEVTNKKAGSRGGKTAKKAGNVHTRAGAFLQKRSELSNISVEKDNASGHSQSESEPEDDGDNHLRSPHASEVNVGSSSRKVKESGAKRKRPQTILKGHNSASDTTLLDVIKSNGKQVSQAAKEWVLRYESDKKSALPELLIMLFETCGVKYNADEGDLNEMDVDNVVISLVNQAKNENIVDYFRSKQKELKNFKENLLLFWDTVVLECQDGALFDQLLMEKCMDYVIALSCTPPRVFRQVTTLVGLQLVTSLVTVAKTLCGQRETTQRQLNAEKKKRRDGPRLESLNKTLSVTHEKITMAEDMMRKLFTGLFMHRYRDVDLDVRVACIRAIGSWIQCYPSLFLQDLYLKYIGWNLNDKNAAVRKASIMSLQMLYEVDDNVPSLGLFTERFCSRMIELADDVDISVSVSAIRLLKQLLRDQLVADDELGSLYDLLLDESPNVRRAVGELVYDHLIAQKFSSSQAMPKGTMNEESEVHIGRLLQILKEFSADPILADYVIDSLWEDMKAMKDWKCIISLLIDDNPRIELSNKDATNLVRVLCASVKKAVGERIVSCPDSKKPSLSKSQKESLENNKREVTIAVMKHYPQLLRKYLADKAKAPALVEIITHMNLELYSLKRQEQTFITTLQLIKDAFFKHGEGNALKACVKALTFCASESQAELQDSARNKVKELENELVHRLKLAIKQAGVTEDEYTLTVNLKRLHQLQVLKFVSIDTLFSDMLGLLKDFSNIDDEVTSYALTNMYLHVLWSSKMLRSEQLSDSAREPFVSNCEKLLNQLQYFTDNTLESWEQGISRPKLASTICIIWSDIWDFFSRAKPDPSEHCNIGFIPEDPLLSKYWKLIEFCLNHENTEDDDISETLDEMSQKELLVQAAGKLVANDIVPKEFLGPKLLSHFTLHGKGVADLLKLLVNILKKNSRHSLPQMFFEAVKMAYEQVLKNNEDSGTSKSFMQCKKLASQLALTLSGNTTDESRTDLLTIAKNGVSYAFADLPKHLLFLEAGVLEFAVHLPPSDMQQIVKDIQGRVEGYNTDEDPSGWRPYFSFIESLQEKSMRNEGNEEKETIPGRMHSRKVKTARERRLDEQDTTDDEDHEDYE